jgi:hypothetical protein
MIDTNEIAEEQAAIDEAAPAVQAEIAKLDVPWSVTRTGLGVVEPAAGDPFTPFYVSLERHGGLESAVVAVTSAISRSQAIRLADAHCRAELAAYQKEVTAILKRHGVYEAGKTSRGPARHPHRCKGRGCRDAGGPRSRRL